MPAEMRALIPLATWGMTVVRAFQMIISDCHLPFNLHYARATIAFYPSPSSMPTLKTQAVSVRVQPLRKTS